MPLPFVHMVEVGRHRALRAVVVVAALLAISSVVLWPIAVTGLPLLRWAACGGRLAHWTASLVGALVVVVASLISVWVVVDAVRGTPPWGSAWQLAVAVVVGPVALVGFLRGSRWARDRRGQRGSTKHGPLVAAP